MTGIYHHQPGKLSKWGVVDVGLRCMHACSHCYYRNLDDDPDPLHGMKHAKFLPTEHLLDLARALKENGFLGFDVTGGEPCLHGGIVELAHEARRLGLAMRIITLGQYLTRPMKLSSPDRPLIEALLDAGVADFLLSVHAVNDADFKRITGESWRKMRDAMDRLDAVGYDYGTNTTVFEYNFRRLPEIADEIIKHRVYVANLIVMNAYYAWSRPGGAAKAVQGHYGEIRPYLLESRDKLEAAGIAVNIRYAPLCTVRGAERNLVGIVGVRHDPHEWMNQMDHMQPGPAQAMGRRLLLRDHDAGAPLEPVYEPSSALGLCPQCGAPGKTREKRPNGNDQCRNGHVYPSKEARPSIIARRSGKVFPTKCKGCAAAPVCDGIDARYLAERGDSELEPYTEFRGDLLDRERLAYAPAFICKTEPFADARAAVRTAFGMTNR